MTLNLRGLRAVVERIVRENGPISAGREETNATQYPPQERGRAALSVTTPAELSNDFSAPPGPASICNDDSDQMLENRGALRARQRAARLIAACWLASVCRLVAAQPAAPATPRPRTAKPLATVSVTWQGQPLRLAVENLARSQRAAIVIDRRLDPGTPLTGQFSDAEPDALLAAAAQRAGGASTRLGDVYYLGPQATAARLRTVAALLSQGAKALAKPARDALLKKKPLVWDDFDEPRRILAGLADEAHLRLEGIEQIPHDLWAAVKTPPLGWTDRLTLVLAQFDRTVVLEEVGSVARIVPLPQTAVIQQSYPGGTSAERTAQRIRERLPMAEVTVADGAVLVRARVEEHESLAAKRPAGKVSKPTAGARRFQLQLGNVPLRDVLLALEKRLEVSFAYDADELTAAGVDLNQLASVRVEDATLDELLIAVLSPAGLAFRHEEDGTIAVFPAAPAESP